MYVSDDDSQSTNCSGERETTHDRNEDEKNTFNQFINGNVTFANLHIPIENRR